MARERAEGSTAAAPMAPYAKSLCAYARRVSCALATMRARARRRRCTAGRMGGGAGAPAASDDWASGGGLAEARAVRAEDRRAADWLDEGDGGGERDDEERRVAFGPTGLYMEKEGATLPRADSDVILPTVRCAYSKRSFLTVLYSTVLLYSTAVLTVHLFFYCKPVQLYCTTVL